ncbi:dihydrodipicolinate synthase family protein [Georgenia sp. TF02-10]|uniref:dihydrodipicolinate synthase family protein n=1 Tax=Georgenia sp. TF02-10 TaxID=2917725 RepID=UPI001FA7580A|nr:dihydrodipicolinate synthase family protein [Georgenia sp. TF02-10]UNX53742.1 dihydrodipicolinate synthase family protein [Georgenia sp. TF02-10]
MSTQPLTAPSVLLPGPDGARAPYRLGEPGPWTRPARPLTARVAYAAAHVVPAVGADNTPGRPAELDWDATLAFRHHLWSYGLGVAEAMDTAQRGMGLDWPAAAELIRRSAAEARSVGAAIACGAGTDQLDLADLGAAAAGAPARAVENGPGTDMRSRRTTTPAALARVTDAYREQLATVTGAGAKPILMASRALAAVARDAEDYLTVYSALLAESTEPVILHWLGEAFDPALAGYWGARDPYAAGETVLGLIAAHPGRVDGIKVSLLDAELEVWLRERLPAGVRMYTGDDYNYPDLVVGDDRGHSDALLGVFAAIAPAAATALQELEPGGDRARAHEILAATQDLGRHIFAAPTYYYKAGVAFLAWLNGHQPGFQMVGGLHAGRSVPHLVELFRLADRAGLLLAPDLAARRMSRFLAVAGVAEEGWR